jgi:hypothetical protein
MNSIRAAPSGAFALSWFETESSASHFCRELPKFNFSSNAPPLDPQTVHQHLLKQSKVIGTE